MAQFDGRWMLLESHNIEAFMDATGTSEENKKKAKFAFENMVQEISHNGEEWTVKTIMKHATRENKMVLNTVTDSVALDGRPMKSLLTMEDGKLIDETDMDGTSIRHERIVQGDEMKLILSCNGVVATRKYKRQG